MNELRSHERPVQRAVTLGVIALAHVGMFAVLNAVGPEIRRTFVAPIEIAFIAEREQPKEEWQPPKVDFVPTAITSRLPEAITIEFETAPPERAISVAPAAAPPRASPGTSDHAPRLVSAVEYIKAPAPRYPTVSRRQGEHGVVILKVLIDPNGHAVSIEVHRSSGYARLDHAARDAVERAQFRPYVEDGIVQAALVLIPIEFSLNSLPARAG